MSGGSFNYLCSHYGDRDEDLRAMASELRALGFHDAAAATESFVFRPSEELRRVWKAVEWWRSCDWGRDDAIKAAQEWRERDPVERQAAADGWLCRCGRFISGAELAAGGGA